MPTTAEPDTIPIDAYCVALVETENYFIDDEDKPHIREIRGVYLFDRNCRTFCCEMTPSHYLIYLYDQVVFNDGVPEETASALVEKYEYLGGEDRYVHCHSVEALIKPEDGPNCCHLGTPFYRTGRGPVPYDEMSRDEQMDSLRETYSTNPPL